MTKNSKKKRKQNLFLANKTTVELIKQRKVNKSDTLSDCV